MSAATAVRLAPVVATSLLLASCGYGGLDGMSPAGGLGGATDGSQAMLAMAQSHGEIVPAAARLPIASLLPRTGWTATASDAGTAPAEPARNVLDGNRRTMWHSRWTRHDPPFPHTITLDLHRRTQVSGLVALPRQDGIRRGRIGRYAVTVSVDGRSWSTVATGTWADTAAAKTVTFATVTVRFVRLTARSEADGPGTASELVELDLLGPSTTTPVSGRPLPRAGWRATASDAQTGSPGHPAAAVLDGNPATVWSSRYAPSAALPHSLTIDMGRATTVRGLTYLPRQDGLAGGRIGAYRVSVSSDGRVFGAALAGGTWADDARAKAVGFRQVRTRFVRLTALTEAGRRGPWSTAAEINLLGTPTAGPAGPTPPASPRPTVKPTSTPTAKPIPEPTVTSVPKPTTPTARPTASPSPTRSASPTPTSSPEPPPIDPAPVIDNSGSWGPVIGFPIVPVSAVLLPGNRLLTFSAYGPNTFSTGGHEQTQTAVLDLASGTVSQRQVTETGQEMFCSGIAVLPDGRVLVNGGSDSGATSIYSPVTDSWSTGPTMNIPRAYEGDVTLSTGQVFTLGGSWQGGLGGKNGEVYTPDGSWARVPGVQASSILTTTDPQGVYREDNQGWFFATAGGGVFHAGPSRAMHWFTTTGSGSTTAAGSRGDDTDAMNGNAVLYGIGKIFTDGGATAYQNADATANAFTIDISGGPTRPVTVTRQAPMAFPRAFQNSVVLPDGTVLVVGGQSHPVPFTDTGAALTPELWNPATGRFTLMAPQSVARTYHSVALLLPDGRVFSGGGGLCGDGCATNHPDGQIFTPPYLLNPDGSLRDRPSITAAPGTASPGDTLTVATGGAVRSFALVRTGAVTHTVDSDQRRVPLASTALSSTSYRVTLPASSGTVVPGTYLLFALDAAGTPSVSVPVTIS